MKTIKIKTRSVACSGGEGASGHPKVYLTIKTGESSVKCPYCGQVYEYKE